MLRCSDLFIRLRGTSVVHRRKHSHVCVLCTKHKQVHIQLSENLLLLVEVFQGSLKVQGKETSQGNITHDIEVALLYKLMWVMVLQQVLQSQSKTVAIHKSKQITHKN